MKTKEAYAEYLKSEHWRRLRLEVLKRDGNCCTRCPSKDRLQAHHKFYRAEWTDSVVGDLVTLCRACHEKEHGIAPMTDAAALLVPRTWKQLHQLRSQRLITREEYDKYLPALRHTKESKKSKRNNRLKKMARKRFAVHRVEFRNSVKEWRKPVHWVSRGMSSN